MSSNIILVSHQSFKEEQTELRQIYSLLGVRSLANASRARQFNPLNPPGVGWVPLPQTNMAAVVGRAWSVMRDRARSCVVVRGRDGHACAVVRGHAWSVVRGRSFVVVRGRAWSCVVVRGRAVLPPSWPALPCCPRTNNI